jgi:hypothetical protein
VEACSPAALSRELQRNLIHPSTRHVLKRRSWPQRLCIGEPKTRRSRYANLWERGKSAFVGIKILLGFKCERKTPFRG